MQNHILSLLSSIFVLSMMGCDMSEFKSLDEIEAVPFEQRDDSSMAQIMSEGFVKKALKSPSTAKFPGVFSDSPAQVIKIGVQKYKIVSWVDAQNSFGAMIRNQYSIILTQDEPHNWIPSEFFLDGQKIY